MWLNLLLLTASVFWRLTRCNLIVGKTLHRSSGNHKQHLTILELCRVHVNGRIISVSGETAFMRHFWFISAPDIKEQIKANAVCLCMCVCFKIKCKPFNQAVFSPLPSLYPSFSYFLLYPSLSFFISPFIVFQVDIMPRAWPAIYLSLCPW